MPDLVGEFGRYTVATHSVFLIEVGATKAGAAGEAAREALAVDGVLGMIGLAKKRTRDAEGRKQLVGHCKKMAEETKITRRNARRGKHDKRVRFRCLPL